MPRTDSIDNSMDVIDSRDVIARIAALEDERDGWRERVDDPLPSPHWPIDNPEDAAELAALKALANDLEDYGDWAHGETLIRASYFQDYAEELAEDCGMLKNATAWPLTCIDWEKAANELKMDYTTGDFDGVTYYMRA